MSFIKKHHVLLFFATWLLLNLIQAGKTELFDDEAYYWLYSKFLDWGYFDHPPMIAFLIRCGYALFNNEFGVRLLVVIISTLTLYIIYRLLPEKNDGLFYAITCSLAVLQIAGIIAVPDIPLTFFVAVFFLLYKKFLEKMSLQNALLLGLVMALMLYSKYHGVLIILFTFLSNPKLFTKYQAYLAALTGAVLYIPHLYWQYSHDFPSVQFHLFERNASYSIKQTLEYVFGQLLLTGPFMGWMIILAAFRYQTTSDFEKALKYSLVGFYSFFLLATLKGRVEANWTSPAFVPLIILSHLYLMNNVNWKRILIKTVPATLILVLLARIYMMVEIKPLKAYQRQEVHKNKIWTQQIFSKTHQLPVVFISSYQKASKYWFYTGITTFSLNTPDYRRNNFNFWHIEDSLPGKKVAVVFSYEKKKIPAPLDSANYRIIDSFFSFSRLKINTGKKAEVTGGWLKDCILGIEVEENQLKALQAKNAPSINIEMAVFDGKKLLGRFPTGITLSGIRQQKQAFQASFPVEVPKGEYQAKFAVTSAVPKYPSLNSTVIELIVR